jgi:hypothetical protein
VRQIFIDREFVQQQKDCVEAETDRYVLLSVENKKDRREIKLEDEEKKALISEIKEKLLLRTVELCDKKQQEVLSLILGYKATSSQIERYKNKGLD